MNILIFTKKEHDLELSVENGSLSARPRYEKNVLKRFQAYVGGLLEVVSLGSMTGIPEFDDIEVILNEEGKLQGLFPSLVFLTPDQEVSDYIAGNAILCSTDEDGNWVGLDPDTIAKLTALIQHGQSNHGKVLFIKQEPSVAP